MAGDEHIRRVRAPRFSDDDWGRLERQLYKVRSPKHTPFKPHLMTAHELVWLATMRVVELLEGTPKGDKPFSLEEVVGRPGAAPAPAAAGSRKVESALSARSAPVWPGAKLTNADLGLKLDWEQLPKPSGDTPAELIPAMIREHRARDMRDCPVEIAVRGPQPQGRRRPPKYSKVCCICDWPHALPPDWPFDDGGAKLDDEQRAKLEECRKAASAQAAPSTVRESSAKSPRGLKVPPGCGLCKDSGRRDTDETPCRCRTEGLVCGLCDDEGFYSAGTSLSLSPCTCAAGRGIVAKGSAYVKRCRRELMSRRRELSRAEDTPSPVLPLQEREGAAQPSASTAGKKVPPACGLCEDTGRHIIDKDVCRCRTKGLVCGLCDDQGFYTVGPSLSPCTCAAGQSIVAKGPAYVRRCKEELSTAKRAERAALKAPPGSSDEFYTPSRIFLPLHEEFGFTLDVCATEESTKVPERFFTKDDDALADHCIWEGQVWWCNPPYSPGNLEAFLAKCDQEARKPGHRVGVALLPARTGNSWWHQYIASNLELQVTNPDALPFSLEVRFHKGRIAFGWPGNPEGGKGTGRDNSAFVIWRRRA